MITSVKIKDNTKTPFEYVSDIEAFENGREFIFKSGVNVIIGKNGSGKSTLLNIISMYMLCEKSMCSEMPTEALDWSSTESSQAVAWYVVFSSGLTGTGNKHIGDMVRAVIDF